LRAIFSHRIFSRNGYPGGSREKGQFFFSSLQPLRQHWLRELWCNREYDKRMLLFLFSSFDRAGRYVLAIAPLAGWIIGIAMDLPKSMVITLLGFISGAIIMNTLIMELPREKEGKFWPFLVGGILYAAILIPLG